MVGVTADEGGRRRLPQWMLGISSAGQVKESVVDAKENEALGGNSDVLVKCDVKGRKRKSLEQDSDDECEVPEKKCNGRGRRKVQESAASKRQKAKGPGKGIQLHENEPLHENLHVLAKCETKRRKRKLNEQDAEGDCNASETFPEKKSNGHGRRKVRESVALNRRKAKGSSCGSDVEQEDQISTDDDDVELTVDDLVTIAKEHIEADRHAKQKEASDRERESDSRVAERVSSSNKLKDSADAQNCIQRSFIPDTRSSKPNGSLTSKEIAISASSTGDPAQDMLDLFLGPLLRKTVEKETQTQSLAEDVAFAYEMKRESHSNAVKEEIAPVTKKKSSLKDKVAMFLD